MFRKICMTCIALALTGLQAVAFSPAQAGSLKITRLHIYFGNYRSEITVPQDHNTLTAYVELDYDGVGLLQGHWEVDGQILAHVRRHLDRSHDGAIALTSPKSPGLPTWQIGGHRVRFVLTDPALGQAEPEALYYVTAKQVIAKGIELTSPAQRASLDRSAHTFSWTAQQKHRGYLLTFFDEPGNTVFSVYTSKQAYSLPAATLDKVFQAGEQYQWQVWGYDEEFNKRSGSVKQNFSLKP